MKRKCLCERNFHSVIVDKYKRQVLLMLVKTICTKLAHWQNPKTTLYTARLQILCTIFCFQKDFVFAFLVLTKTSRKLCSKLPKQDKYTAEMVYGCTWKNVVHFWNQGPYQESQIIFENDFVLCDTRFCSLFQNRCCGRNTVGRTFCSSRLGKQNAVFISAELITG